MRNALTRIYSQFTANLIQIQRNDQVRVRGAHGQERRAFANVLAKKSNRNDKQREISARFITMHSHRLVNSVFSGRLGQRCLFMSRVPTGAFESPRDRDHAVTSFPCKRELVASRARIFHASLFLPNNYPKTLREPCAIVSMIIR